MQLSSIRSALAALRALNDGFDVSLLSGADAAELLDEIMPVKNLVDAWVLATSARAVAGNQHTLVGAASGASWVASRTGVSEKQARSSLALSKQLASLPDVAAAVSSGKVSLSQASAIGKAAGGDACVASSLLNTARHEPVELVVRKAQELHARRDDAAERLERLRRSQYVTIETGADSMVTGYFRFLGSHAVGMLDAYRSARGDTSWQRAESFASRLATVPKKRSEVIFHLDLRRTGGELELGDAAQLVGVGPVPLDPVLEVMEHASKTLVGTAENKLTWFSEQDRRSSTKELPAFIKRAIHARDRHSCQASGCASVSEHVDHIQARCNQGTNDFENMGTLCEPDHHAKTKQDAPWTQGAIYSKKRNPAASALQARPKRKTSAELFPDSG